ncbi:V-type ATP synthase subunit E [Stetteria hydrogenophila]
MAKLYGDPGRVAEEAVRAELEKALRELEEARRTALSMLEDKREKLLVKAEEKAIEAHERVMEKLRSERAKRELKLRTALAEEKSRHLDKVIEAVVERIKAAKAGAEWYERYMRRVMEAVAAEAEAHGGFVVSVAAEDMDLARDIAKRLKGVEVSKEPASIIGGVIARSKDGYVTLDYTLDYLLKEAEPRLRSIASKILFS